MSIEENHEAITAGINPPSRWRRLLQAFRRPHVCTWDLYSDEQSSWFGCKGCGAVQNRRPWTHASKARPTPPTGGTSARRATYLNEPPPRAPTGGPAETPSPWKYAPGGVVILRGDTADPAFSQGAPVIPVNPVIGFMSIRGFALLGTRSRCCAMAYQDEQDVEPKGGMVEVEIRIRRVIEAP